MIGDTRQQPGVGVGITASSRDCEHLQRKQ